jgi:tripartite-type tricarboxylate transporter receptor subunit TctC
MLVKYALALTALLLPASLVAQTTQKTIQIIVPFAPGASADGIARIIGSELGQRLERQVVIENKAGAGGSLGLVIVAKALPDGNTLAIGAPGALVINPHLPNATLIDPLRDLAPIAKLVEIPIVLVSNLDVGPKSIPELIARSKMSSNGLSYASTGVNSAQHLDMELLKQATGANLVHVPYRGSAPAMTDVLGGQVPLASVDLTSAYPYIQAGRVIALGLADNKRTPLAPQIPTIAESGVPGFGRAPGFIGLFAPAGTPAAVIKKYSNEIREILATPEVQAKIRLLSMQVAFLDDIAFAKFLASESAKWKLALQSIGLIK